MLYIYYLAIGLSLATTSNAIEREDAHGIPIISTNDYDPRDENARGLKAFFGGIGLAIVGPGKDLKKEILAKMNEPALKEYFPNEQEREEIAEKISDGMQEKYLSEGYNNRNTLGALGFATNELIDTIMKRVLEKEGLKDEFRAEIWSKKILSPYKACMGTARTYSEGGKCGTALETDLVKNMGLAMTYELSRQEFGASLAKPRAKEYSNCLQPERRGANDRVKDCAFQGIKNAAKDFGRLSILEAAKKQVSPKAAEKIAAKVIPEFVRCLNATNDRTGFVKCGDKLLGAAGAELAAEAIRADPRVGSAFSSNQQQIEQIALSGREAFNTCIRENELKNRRDRKGTLLTGNCENFVKMETARFVVLEVLRVSTEKNMASASLRERDQVLKESFEQINQCWNSDKGEKENAPCMRRAAKQLAVGIAREKLGRELPSDALASDPKLRGRLLSNFERCLEKRMPENLFSATNPDAAAESCAGEIFKQAALLVAESKVRSSLARVSSVVPGSDDMNPLIDSFVKGAFANCLGDQPDADRLSGCSLKLQKNVASTIAQALLPFKVDEFFRAGGGLEAYGMKPENRQELLNAVIFVNKSCLRTTVKSTNAEESERQINDCFKLTVRDLALRLGGLELERIAKANGIDDASPTFAELRDGFNTEFGACLDEKKDPSVPLDDYLEALEPCQARITKSLTVKIVKSELSSITRSVFTDASSEPERANLEEKLLASFDSCMKNAGSPTEREACVRKLKADATRSLARAGMESRALKELGEIPAEIQAYGQDLERCEAEGSEDCARTYLKNSTIILGTKMMHKGLRGELKERFDALQPQTKPLELGFGECVNATDGAIDQRFLDALGECGLKLTEASLEFLLNNLRAAPSDSDQPKRRPAIAVETPDPKGKELAEMMARTMLCLNGQLSPGNESGLQNIEPESVEAELLQIIGAYVSYALAAANGKFELVLQKVGEDLKSAGPESARRKLLEELVVGGMVDQLLKSMIRSEIDRGLKLLPDDKRPSGDFSKALLDKTNLDKALTLEVMDKVRPLVLNGILEPILLEGRSLKSSPVLKSLRSLKQQSLEALYNSPHMAQWKVNPAFSHLKDALE